MRTACSESLRALARLCAPVWCALLIVTAAAADPAPHPADRFAVAGISEGEAQSFLATLQGALRQHDTAGIAAVTRFPLMVNGRPGARDAQELTRYFSAIFTDRVRDAVLAAHPENLFASWRGVMIGSGIVWFAADCGTDPGCASGHPLRIIAINNKSLKAENPR
jgi:hypothetical protein